MAIALVAGAWVAGPVWTIAAAPVALVLLVFAVARVRNRPLSRWIGDGIRFFGRRRTLPAGSGGAALLALVRPGASTSSLDVDGADVGVLEDTDGLVAIVRVGEVSALLGTALPPLPPLSALLPTPTRDVPEVRVQLLVSAVTAPPPSATPSATSYRQLTEGRVLAHQRVLIAVRVRRAGGYRRADLEQSLIVAVRRVTRLVTKAGLPALPLSAPSALTAVMEAAQHDPTRPVRETWSGLTIGGLHQAVFRLRRWPSDQGPLMTRLLTLPSSATTLSLTAQSPGPSTTAAPTPSPAAPARVPAQYAPSSIHAPDDPSALAMSGARPASAHTDGYGGYGGSTGPGSYGGQDDYTGGRPGFAHADGHGGYDSSTSPGGYGGQDGHAGGRPGVARQREGGAHDGLDPVAADATSAVSGAAVRAELVLRLSAPTAAALVQATAALRRLVASMDAKVTRLDGAQLDGLAATLPLGGGAPGEDAVLAGLVSGRDGLILGGGRPITATPALLSATEPTVGGEGVVMGVNRRGDPVVVRLFRPEPTRAALIGGLRCAQLVILRALATGARVVVQSARPPAWEPFQRALGPAEPMAVVPPGPVAEPPPASATRPQLLVIDVGPVAGRSVPVPESAWRTVLHVRDDLTSSDTDLLTRADLALLQPLSPHEAALAGDALGLGDSRDWLTRISAEMLGVVVNRQTVRWTQLATTPLEHQLTGGPAR
ncbi:type VII secretion protein EccE [Dactylosporangium sp. CA-139066]|uniref:type VII secretion protein EccE n=1 Tax=Dactylosporangium sp. CA-139066 TaxID=3239930 RepID=UPI003D92E0AE